MTYNIHPIIVHFPVALLFLYSIIKILPVQKWMPSVAWRDVERVFLVFGILGAMAANATGEVAENLVKPNHDLVEAHAMFASISTWLYGLLLVGEIFAVVNIKLIPKLQIPLLTKLGILVEKVFCHIGFSKIMAFFALITISITGMLGGAMVYGLSADPLVPLILKILGINL
jgi:uncharacterized membrane protein